MSDFLTPSIIVGLCMYFFYKTIEVLAHRKERMMFVEKMDQLQNTPASAELAKLLKDASNKPYLPLRIGSLLLGLGLGMIIGFIICNNCLDIYVDDINRMVRDMSGTVMAASTILFGGLGLLVSFIIEKRMQK